MSNINPNKSILRHPAANSATSWLAKLNDITITTTINPTTPNKINSLLVFRKKPSEIAVQQVVVDELRPECVRRVRFPVTEMTTEYIFKRDDLVTDLKSPVLKEPVQIHTLTQLLSLYQTVCRDKQEPTIDMFVTTLIAQPHAAFLTRLDLSNQPLDRNNIAPFSEIMSIEFGMRELVLDGCGLEDSAIKILMHSLLENDKIKQLSLANNPKISTTGFKYIAVYVKGSSQLTTLNLSYTQPDKKAIEYLMNAIVKSTPDSTRPFLSCLVLDNCNLRVAQLEVLAAGIKKPTCLRQLFISHQRMLNQQGALSIGVMLRDYDTTVYHGLQRLCLDHSPMNSNGIQYITQALRRNQSLRYLSMQDCNIDSASCYLLAEALKYNQFLEKLDLACNALCKPTMEGMTHITQALTINRSLKDFCLAETKIFTEAIIILAECLAENNTLIRLDLSRNPDIQMAALMALAASVRRNDTITFIDIHIPTQDKEMVSIHNDILSKCTKNAQTRKSDKSVRSDNPIYATTAQATARLTLKERLAAVTGAKKPIHDDAALIQQALEHITSLEGSNPSANILYASQQTLSNISTRIPEVVDPSQLDILLTMNDRLTLAIERYTYKE